MTIERQLAPPTDNEAPTAAHSVGAAVTAPGTGELLPQVAALRYRTQALHQDAASLDREVFQLNLEERATRRERDSVASLLDYLTHVHGLGWTSIARMLGVSTPAIRKWRLGEGTSPANRKALAHLAGLVEMLEEQYLIADPGSWLEVPLPDGVTTLSDVCAAGNIGLILDLAGSKVPSSERVLDEFRPGWRELRATREFETFVDDDGEVGIRPTQR